jgi:putative toxin-antitoxin system antitoxin component (TIGR02293 family)
MSDIALMKEVFGWKGLLRGVNTDLELDRWMTWHRPPRSMAASVFRNAALPPQIRFRVVPKATYHRSNYLSPNAFERVLRIGRLYARALTVFDGDAQEASAFLSDPHPLLDDRPPAEVALSEPGFREVEGLLRKLEFGLPV